MSALVLAACAAPVSRPLPAGLVAGVAVEGQALAVAVAGAGLAVTRPGGLGMDEGLVAKRAALAFCADQGLGLDPRALGSWVGGAWIFDGGCR